MIGVEQIEAWRGQQVLDGAGEQLGKLDEVYFDIESGTPVLIAVKSGLLGRRSALVPIDGCTVSREYLRVAHAKAAVERAGQSAPEGAFDAESLSALGAAYGLKFADRLRLESTGEMEAQHAEAEAARARAAELASTARDKVAERDAASERAAGASKEAERAAREAEAARREALDAREQAGRYDPEPQ